MRIIIQFSLMVASPFFFLVYWKNSMKQLDDLHKVTDYDFIEANQY